MRILVIGDFGEGFPEELDEKLGKENFDIILSQGDFSSISEISKAFQKYGLEYEKILGDEKCESIRKRGLDYAKIILERLNSYGKPVYIVRGNNELRKYEEFKKIVDNLENIKLLDFENINLEGTNIIGYPFFFSLRDELERYDELLARLREVCKKVEPEKTILLCHNPPYDCEFDKIPKNKKQNPGKHVGSKVVESVLKEFKFPLMVCGHIEEYQGECSKDSTKVINPGPAELFRYAILEIKDNLREARVEFRK